MEQFLLLWFKELLNIRTQNSEFWGKRNIFWLPSAGCCSLSLPLLSAAFISFLFVLIVTWLQELYMRLAIHEFYLSVASESKPNSCFLLRFKLNRENSLKMKLEHMIGEKKRILVITIHFLKTWTQENFMTKCWSQMFKQAEFRTGTGYGHMRDTRTMSVAY